MNGEFYSSPHDHIPTGNDQLDAGRARSPEKSACRCCCCCLRNREWSIKFVLQPIRIERWWHFGRHQPAAGMKKRNNRRGRKKRRRRIKQPAAARYYWVTRRQSYNDRLVKSLWLIGLFCFFLFFFLRAVLLSWWELRVGRRRLIWWWSLRIHFVVGLKWMFVSWRHPGQIRHWRNRTLYWSKRI